MTLTDQFLAEREAKGTSWSQAARASALGLMLIAPHWHPGVSPRVGSLPISVPNVQDTHQTTSVRGVIGDWELFGQLNRTYDYLLAQRVELEDDARRILYSNLWKR